jgi:hypothetical protein
LCINDRKTENKDSISHEDPKDDYVTKSQLAKYLPQVGFNKLMYEFNKIHMEDGESIMEYYTRFTTLVEQINNHELEDGHDANEVKERFLYTLNSKHQHFSFEILLNHHLDHDLESILNKLKLYVKDMYNDLLFEFESIYMEPQDDAKSLCARLMSMAERMNSLRHEESIGVDRIKRKLVLCVSKRYSIVGTHLYSDNFEERSLEGLVTLINKILDIVRTRLPSEEECMDDENFGSH